MPLLPGNVAALFFPSFWLKFYPLHTYKDAFSSQGQRLSRLFRSFSVALYQLQLSEVFVEMKVYGYFLKKKNYCGFIVHLLWKLLNIDICSIFMLSNHHCLKILSSSQSSIMMAWDPPTYQNIGSHPAGPCVARAKLMFNFETGIKAVGYLSGPSLYWDPTKDLCKWKKFLKCILQKKIYKLPLMSKLVNLFLVCFWGTFCLRFCPLDVKLETFVFYSVIVCIII